ncbi:MAG: AbrB/MazE/SpoVT family DNA-binding domain-containing protein [Candidatus Solibacter sp.]|nr:AbrB/MazE/SpoVT family DNA-binding domain-containing protein [Candidatus Solibacter sp.]
MARNLAVRYMGKVDKAGRVVIPAEIRAKAHLQPGATVTITVGASGRVVLEPTLAIVREAQEYFLSLGPADELWSDELLAERRLEARREIED